MNRRFISLQRGYRRNIISTWSDRIANWLTAEGVDGTYIVVLFVNLIMEN